MLYLPIHLIQSALGRKVEVKPVGFAHRERSQCWTAMSGSEVACLAGVMGLPMGLNSGRVSPFRTKSVFPASTSGSRAAIYAVSGMLRVKVLHAVTSHTWFVHLTDELPRCPGPGGRVSARYKPYAKGSRHAPVSGTGSPRPRLKGTQQRQSSPALRDERQYLGMPARMVGFMGLVSSGPKATKWLGGTAYRQHPGSLNNNPQQPDEFGRRFVTVRRNHHGLVSDHTMTKNCSRTPHRGGSFCPVTEPSIRVWIAGGGRPKRERRTPGNMGN